jgi:hypothetical protein
VGSALVAINTQNAEQVDPPALDPVVAVDLANCILRTLEQSKTASSAFCVIGGCSFPSPVCANQPVRND